MEFVLFSPTVDRLKGYIFVWQANFAFGRYREIWPRCGWLRHSNRARKCHDNHSYIGINDCDSKVGLPCE